MKYWDDFQTKWGFGDGDAMPPDAWACRAVYIRAINRLARKRGQQGQAGRVRPARCAQLLSDRHGAGLFGRQGSAAETVLRAVEEWMGLFGRFAGSGQR